MPGLAPALVALLLAAPSYIHANASGSAPVAIECTSSATNPNWPTFHIMNRVTRCVLGKDKGCLPWDHGLSVAHLNDANAIFEYKGVYHAMNQGGHPTPGGTGRATNLVAATRGASILE